MWITREAYEAFISDRSRLHAAEPLIERLEREVTYWREKFEAEQARADRVVDAHFASGGIAPVSNVGINESRAIASEMKAHAEKVLGEMAEVGRDSDDEPFDELRIDPALMAKLVNANG